MITWCGGTIALGIALAGMVSPTTEGLGRAYYLMAAGFDADAFAFDAPGMRFGTAILGAVTIGWGLVMLGVVREAAKGSALWRHLTFAIAAWFVIDSALSVAAGFPYNAVLNIALLASFLAPVLGSGVLMSEQHRVKAA
jgi:hypothetical protein